MLNLHITLSWWLLPPAIWTAFCLWLTWLDNKGGELRGESAVFFIICAVVGLVLMLATRFLP